MLRNAVRESLESFVGNPDRKRLRRFGRRDRDGSLIGLPDTARRKRSDRAEDENGFEEGFSLRISHLG